jgi:hypothetical protein
MVHKSILEVPYNGDMNYFAYPLDGFTFLNDEDGVAIWTCLPGFIDPDTGNTWSKELDSWDE